MLKKNTDIKWHKEAILAFEKQMLKKCLQENESNDGHTINQRFFIDNSQMSTPYLRSAVVDTILTSSSYYEDYALILKTGSNDDLQDRQHAVQRENEETIANAMFESSVRPKEIFSYVKYLHDSEYYPDMNSYWILAGKINDPNIRQQLRADIGFISCNDEDGVQDTVYRAPQYYIGDAHELSEIINSQTGVFDAQTIQEARAASQVLNADQNELEQLAHNDNQVIRDFANARLSQDPDSIYRQHERREAERARHPLTEQEAAEFQTLLLNYLNAWRSYSHLSLVH